MSSETPAVENPKTVQPNRWGPRIVLVLLAAVVVPVCASVMVLFPPSEYNFYPRCPFRLVTEIVLGVPMHCAGCGATRSLAALLHGNLAQAFAYNPLFVLLLPLLVFGGSRTVYETWTGKKAARLRVPPWMMKALVVVLIAFWIARNLGVYPFNLLAPHEI